MLSLPCGLAPTVRSDLPPGPASKNRKIRFGRCQTSPGLARLNAHLSTSAPETHTGSCPDQTSTSGSGAPTRRTKSARGRGDAGSSASSEAAAIRFEGPSTPTAGRGGGGGKEQEGKKGAYLQSRGRTVFQKDPWKRCIHSAQTQQSAPRQDESHSPGKSLSVFLTELDEKLIRRGEISMSVLSDIIKSPQGRRATSSRFQSTPLPHRFGFKGESVSSLTHTNQRLPAVKEQLELTTMRLAHIHKSEQPSPLKSLLRPPACLVPSGP